MGVLRRLTEEEIDALARLSNSNDFGLFRGLLKDSLLTLRESSDFIMAPDDEYISKGKRQCLREILEISKRDTARKNSDRVSGEARVNAFV